MILGGYLTWEKSQIKGRKDIRVDTKTTECESSAEAESLFHRESTGQVIVVMMDSDALKCIGSSSWQGFLLRGEEATLFVYGKKGSSEPGWSHLMKTRP